MQISLATVGVVVLFVLTGLAAIGGVIAVLEGQYPAAQTSGLIVTAGVAGLAICGRLSELRGQR